MQARVGKGRMRVVKHAFSRPGRGSYFIVVGRSGASEDIRVKTGAESKSYLISSNPLCLTFRECLSVLLVLLLRHTFLGTPVVCVCVCAIHR